MRDTKYSGIIDLVEEKSLCHYDKDDLLIEQGKKATCILFIVRGTAKVVHKNSKGKEFNFLQVQAGDYLGIHSLLGKECAFASVIANEPLTAYKITEEELNHAMEEKNEISLEVMKQLCSKIGLVESKITKLSQKNIKERIAEILLANKKTRSTADQLPFYTIHELADLVGTTNNYVYKILSELQQMEVLAVKKKNVMVLNKVKLKHYLQSHAT